MNYQAEFQRWLENVTDEALLSELHAMTEAQREDAFYRELSFGTGGLRGVIGAGTNRMNVYVVAKASQGLANHLLRSGETRAVVIGYDSRINSALFAQTAASVFAANGIAVHFWRELTPVPTVSYAIRRLKASYGVMITASHNPAQYNGYKVYGSDGCQVTSDAAAAILTEIQRLDVFRDIAATRFDDAVASGGIQFIKPQVLDGFIEEVKRQSVLFGDAVDKNVSLVYTPLNGTGLQPVTRVLRETGFTNITVVEEQRCPDGNFPTCPSPNPEVREAMALGLTYCSRCGADLLLATDPDCDRCGIAVRDKTGAYRLLSANETGLLLLDFICAQRTKHGKMPPHPVFIKTIVTTDLAETVARHYGVRTVNVLTGFKYVCEQVGRLQNQDDYIFGFEESYGYLAGAYVRDKDSVNAAFLISEMFAYYKTHGISLTEKLEELYNAFGYCLNTQHAYTFDGSAGMAKMRVIMKNFRSGLTSLAGEVVQKTIDYSHGINGLPPSDVIKLHTASCSAVIRPSGTEPKLKVYISVTAKDEVSAKVTEAAVAAEIETIIRTADEKTE